MAYIKSNPLLPPTSKVIRPYNCSFVSIEGPSTTGTLSLSGLEIKYDSCLTTRLTLNPESQGQPLLYGFFSNSVLDSRNLGPYTFVMIKVTYPTGEASCVDEEDNYLEFYFADDPGTIRYIGKLMVLTGNSVNRVPLIYLNNPTGCYIDIDVMLGSLDQGDVNGTGTDVTKISGLYYNSVISDSITLSGGTSGSTQFQVLNSSGSAVLYVDYRDVEGISLDGTTMTMTTSSESPIVLEFLSAFNARQAFSRMQWVLHDPALMSGVAVMISNRWMTTNYPILDLVAPDIYTLTTGTTLHLGTGWTYSSLRSHYIDYVFDLDGDGCERDGVIDNDNVGVLISRTGGLEPLTGITEMGIYGIVFVVTDIAGNTGSLMLENVYVDDLPPVITFKSVASGSQFTMTLPDNAAHPTTGITHGDIRTYSIASVFDAVDGLIDTSTVVLSIEGLAGPLSGLTGITNITQKGGAYRVTYSVSDHCGNTTTTSKILDVDGLWYLLNSGDTYIFNEYETEVSFKYLGDAGTTATIVLAASGATTGQSFLIQNPDDLHLVWDYTGTHQTTMDVGDTVEETWNNMTYTIGFSGLGCLEFDVSYSGSTSPSYVPSFLGNSTMSNCSGDLEDGFVLVTDRRSASTYALNFHGHYATDIPLASTMQPVYLTEVTGSALELLLYYSGHTTDPAHYLYYSDMIDGDVPYAYLDGSDGELYDGAEYYLSTNKTGIISYGDHPLDALTFSGSLTDVHGNTGTLAFGLSVTTNLSVLGSGETYVFSGATTGVSFEYSGGEGTTGYITISGTTFGIHHAAGDVLIWDLSGSTEYTFTATGETLEVSVYGRVFEVTFNGWGSLLFTVTDTDVPSSPTLLSPDDEATGVTAACYLSWSAVTAASTYEYEVSRYADFHDPIEGSTASTGATTDPLRYSETYYWRAKTVVGEETSVWSSARTFTTVALEEPLLASPADGGVDLPTNLTTIDWSDVEGGAFYTTEYGTDTGMTSSVSGLTVSEYDLTGLTVSTTYYWRARGNDGYTDGPWSSTWTFTTSEHLTD